MISIQEGEMTELVYECVDCGKVMDLWGTFTHWLLPPFHMYSRRLRCN